MAAVIEGVMAYQKIEVMAYSGYQGDERPLVFVINGEKINVAEILDMWIEEGLSDRTRKRCFVVKTDDQKIYRIYCDKKTLEWFCETR
jgi:hypothetical protein